jgi:hypothetical protein
MAAKAVNPPFEGGGLQGFKIGAAAGACFQGVANHALPLVAWFAN